MLINLRPISHFNCNGCRANAHSEPEASEHIHVHGNCGERKTLGGCFGVVLYPVFNPSTSQHEKFAKTIAEHNNRQSAESLELSKKQVEHIIGLHEHDLRGSNALDSAKAVA